MKARSDDNPTVGAAGIDDLLGTDPFRYTRSDADLRRLERAARRTRARPYWHLLRVLLGIGDTVNEKKAKALWREILRHRKTLSEVVGRPIPMRATAIDWLYLRDERERPVRPLVVSRTALSRLVEEGRRDPLTGLPRPAYFERALAQELSASPFVGGCVVFIDLDGFKQANDRLGHGAGDTVLQRFARVVGRVLRRADLVGRLGGDEFGLALFGIAPRMARTIVERLRDSFEHDCAAERVSFSFGITALQEDDTPRSALDRADASMYRQKRRRTRERLTRASALRR